MGMPVIATVTGTGTFYYFPDWGLTPFQVGLGVAFPGAGTATVDVTFQTINTNTQGEVGTTVGNATWWNVIGLTSANTSANFTTPVQAFRLNVVTAVATTIVQVAFVQAGGFGD